jgi:hypothetical protein
MTPGIVILAKAAVRPIGISPGVAQLQDSRLRENDFEFIIPTLVEARRRHGRVREKVNTV